MNVHAKLIQDLEESLKLCNYQGTKVLQYIGVYNHHMMSRETTTSLYVTGAAA